MEIALLILIIALLADWQFGEPEILWSRMPHPVVLFGKAIRYCDEGFNLESDPDGLRYRKGGFVIAGLIIASIVAGLMLNWLFGFFGPVGWVLEGFVVFAHVAQRSLTDHVGAVAPAFDMAVLKAGARPWR